MQPSQPSAAFWIDARPMKLRQARSFVGGVSLRIGVFTGSFPVVSETFIIRHITGLIDLDQDVRIFANCRPDPEAPQHQEVRRYNLLHRTTYMEGPPESLQWEMPIYPLTGRTWPPGSSHSIRNFSRWTQALPILAKCFLQAPGLTTELLSQKHYGYQAQSLSGVYRLATLRRHPGKLDLLHAHFGPNANSFRFAKRLWKAPLVVSFHGYDFSTTPRKEGAKVYESLWPAADLVMANSKYTQSRLEKLGCPPERIRVLPVGLNPDDFPFRPRTLQPGEPVRILTVARLVKIKGHQLALQALAQLKTRHWRYDIIGDGPLRKDLEQLSETLGIADRVVFHGSKTGPELVQLMNEAHLSALTSVTVEGDQEGQGLALQEAQACGLPVIATRHGAFPEGLLDGVTGVLVPEDNPAQVAQAIENLSANSNQWPDMGKAGREFVCAHYDMRQINRKLLQYYFELVENFNRSR